jgi:uncharacterized damage-inducible protein DinB
MNVTKLFPDLLEREVALSRRILERVPEGRPDWRPHEKSMPLGYLAHLVATMPDWVAMMVRQDELDLNPPGGGGTKPPLPTTAAELTALLDASAGKARQALLATTDAHLATPWRLLVGGRVVWEAARYVTISDTLTHQAHHRGQLTVYLRLLGAPVPALYGPSADEPLGASASGGA